MLADSLIRMPRLIFLSGCRTAESAKQGAMLSLAQELIQHGAKAVLGWGRPVSDTDASMAAAELYGALSCGHELSKALALTYQHLIENNAKDWHLLRLNIAGKMPGALVTPLKTPKREKAKPPSFASRFLDTQHKVRVVSRENFIGRRRFLQRCIKSLRYDSDKIGVLLFGMGGIGKSSLAARLCDRLNDRQPVVRFGKIDESALVNRLCEDLNKSLRDALMNPDEELKFRLRTVFEQHDKPLLLILDDFEANLEMRNGEPVPSVEAKAVIEALSFAILKSEAAHRLIITSRYQFDIRESAYLHREQLTALDKSDVSKKVSRLEKSKVKDSDEIKKLKQQAIVVADGNPRLLEWLFAILSETGLDYEKILSEMAEKETEFRENILAEELLKQQEPELRKMLALASVYELPVPKEAVEAVCKEIADLEKHLERAAALGLIEETILKEETLFRVSRILVPVLKEDLPVDLEGLSGVAVKTVYKIWWEDSDISTEEQDFEIHRLALAGKEKEIAAILTNGLSNKLNKRSRFREVVSLCNNTLNVIGNDYRVLHGLARAQDVLGDVENALKNYQQALQDCPDEDEKYKGIIIHNMAIIYQKQGQIEEALKLFQESLDLGDVQGKASSLRWIATIYQEQGKLYEALDIFRQTLEIADNIGDLGGKSSSLHQMAIIYQNQGKTEEALKLFQESAEIFESIGNVQGKAATFHQMAIFYQSQGKTEEALKLFQESLDLTERIGDVKTKAGTIHQMANIYQEQGKTEEALKLFQESAEISERIGYVQGKAATIHNMAVIYLNQSKTEEARKLLQESAEIFESIGNVQGKASTIHQIAIIYQYQGKTEEALKLFQQSLDLKESIGNINDKAATIAWIAIIYQKQGKIEEALKLFQKALDMQENIGDVQGKAFTLEWIGYILAYKKGDIETALVYLKESLEIFETIGSPEAEKVKEIMADVIALGKSE